MEWILWRLNHEIFLKNKHFRMYLSLIMEKNQLKDFFRVHLRYKFKLCTTLIELLLSRFNMTLLVKFDVRQFIW